jgi:hypothetical protein
MTPIILIGACQGLVHGQRRRQSAAVIWSLFLARALNRS